MAKASLELGELFREYGATWREANRAHLTKPQTLAMRSIEQCRTAALGGHSITCEGCDYAALSYNSCRNRHCPKCQASSAKDWLAAREAELLPISYFHIVFTLPAKIAALAYQNKEAIYRLLFKTSSEALQTLARDKKYLDAQLGMTAILHTWGQNLDFHPHIHMIVTGGGLREKEWVKTRENFLFPVRVISRLFRRLFLTGLRALHQKQKLIFYNGLEALNDFETFKDYLQPAAEQEWVVYAKKPFASPNHVLAYLSRYTHRVAISNSRLLSMEDGIIRFRWKDYRLQGKAQLKVMSLSIDEFIRRFLLHILPEKFHRIRHYGFLAQGKQKAQKMNAAKEALGVTQVIDKSQEDKKGNAFECDGIASGDQKSASNTCPCCGGFLQITIMAGLYPHYRNRRKGFNSS